MCCKEVSKMLQGRRSVESEWLVKDVLIAKLEIALRQALPTLTSSNNCQLGLPASQRQRPSVSQASSSEAKTTSRAVHVYALFNLVRGSCAQATMRRR